MEVASITGHKSMQMLKRYTHLRPESLLQKMGLHQPDVELRIPRNSTLLSNLIYR